MNKQPENFAQLMVPVAVLLTLVWMPVSLIYVHVYVFPMVFLNGYGGYIPIALGAFGLWLARTEKPLLPLVLCSVVWGLMVAWIALHAAQRAGEFPKTALVLGGGELVLIIAAVAQGVQSRRGG